MIKRYEMIESDMLMKEVECFTNAILTSYKEELEGFDEQAFRNFRKEIYELGRDFYTPRRMQEFDLYSRIEKIFINYNVKYK